MESFFTFSRKFISASAGVIPLSRKQPISRHQTALADWVTTGGSHRRRVSSVAQPVGPVQLHDLVLHLPGLVGGKAQLTDVVRPCLL